jgi:hypothetical protein
VRQCSHCRHVRRGVGNGPRLVEEEQRDHADSMGFSNQFLGLRCLRGTGFVVEMLEALSRRVADLRLEAQPNTEAVMHHPEIPVSTVETFLVLGVGLDAPLGDVDPVGRFRDRQ